MNTIESVLDSSRFLRIHRSHIVNVRRIARLWSAAHGQFEVELNLDNVCNPGVPTASASAARYEIHSDDVVDLREGDIAAPACLCR